MKTLKHRILDLWTQCLENWQRVLAFFIAMPVLGWIAYLFLVLDTKKLVSLEYGIMVSSVLISLCVYLATDLSVEAQERANEIQIRPRVYPKFSKAGVSTNQKQVELTNQGTTPAYVYFYSLTESGEVVDEVEPLYLGPNSTKVVGNCLLEDLEDGEFNLKYSDPTRDRIYRDTFQVA